MVHSLVASASVTAYGTLGTGTLGDKGFGTVHYVSVLMSGEEI